MRGAFCPELGGERLEGGRHLHRRVAEPESSAPHHTYSLYLPLILSNQYSLISPDKKKMILSGKVCLFFQVFLL